MYTPTKLNIKYNIFCALANIIILGQGCAIGWISPSIPILLSDRSPLVDGSISATESSWIASTSSIGAAVGTIFFGLICSLVGSKNSTMLCAIPLSVSAFSRVDIKLLNIVLYVFIKLQIFWISVMFSQHAWQLCIGRFMSGLTGGAFVSIQLFIADISHDKYVLLNVRYIFLILIIMFYIFYRIRGRLGSFISLNLNIGILLGYMGGAFLDFRTVPYVMIAFPIIFFCGFMCMPSTPQFLLDKGLFDVSAIRNHTV